MKALCYKDENDNKKEDLEPKKQKTGWCQVCIEEIVDRDIQEDIYKFLIKEFQPEIDKLLKKKEVEFA